VVADAKGSTKGGTNIQRSRNSREQVQEFLRKLGPKTMGFRSLFRKENQPTRKKTAPEVVGSVNVDITMQAQKMALQNRYGNGSKE
jgi:hypothetical protein